MMQRDLLTFTNCVSILVCIYHFRDERRHLLRCLILLSGLSSFAFHATENGSYIYHGLEIDHKVDDSWILEHIFPPELLAFGKANTNNLLILDEAFAVLLILAVLIEISFSFSILKKRSARIFFALATLLISDFLLDGFCHAILHSAWHLQAFALLHCLLEDNDKVVGVEKKIR